MKTRMKVLIGTVMAIGGIAGLAIATPQVGIVFNLPINNGTMNQDVRDHVHVTLGASTAEDDEWNVEFETEGPSNFAFADATIQATGHTGWHTHPGILLISVATGSVEWYDAKCNRTVYNAGDSITEVDKPHYVRNIGTVDSRWNIVYVVPKGAPRRIDIPFESIPACAHAAGIDN